MMIYKEDTKNIRIKYDGKSIRNDKGINKE